MLLGLFCSLKQEMAFGFNQLGLFGKAYVVQERCLCSYDGASAPACVQHYSFVQVNRKVTVTAISARY